MSGLLGVWDGVISTLRIHDGHHLRDMAGAARGVYDWQHYETPYPWGGIATVFFGVPAA